MDYQEIQRQIKLLQAQIDALKDYSTIPLEVGEAMKARIIPDGTPTAAAGTGIPDTVTINEAGVDIVVAAKPFTGKLVITVGENSYIVPTI
jgi:hypothetical protein